MSAHTRIDAATKAISTAYTEASWRDRDTSHAAAVELEARKLLSETRAQLEREIRAELAAGIDSAITEAIASGPADPVLLHERLTGLREALRIARDVPDAAVVDGSPGDLFDPTDPAGGA